VKVEKASQLQRRKNKMPGRSRHYGPYAYSRLFKLYSKINQILRIKTLAPTFLSVAKREEGKRLCKAMNILFKRHKSLLREFFEAPTSTTRQKNFVSQNLYHDYIVGLPARHW